MSMKYQKLIEDILLEIGKQLDYQSLISWTRTSRYHFRLFYNNKPLLLHVTRNWSLPSPVPLPLHVTEGGLTPEDIHNSIRRSLDLERSWITGHFRVSLRETEPITIQQEFPGARIGSMVYFRGTNLVMILIVDADTLYTQYATIYQITPPCLLATWDVGSNTQIISAKSTWVDLGGRYKQLVIGASVGREGWHDQDAAYSLEVVSLDLDEYFASQKPPPPFKFMGKCYWRNPYTNVVLSEFICGGLVCNMDSPIVLTYLNWKNGNAQTILVDAMGNYDLQHIADFGPDIQFSTNAPYPAEIFLWKNWIGLLQVTRPSEVRYFLTPTQFDAETIQINASFPPLRKRNNIVAVGHNTGSADIVSLREQVIHGEVDGAMKLQIITDDTHFDRDRVITLDFEPLHQDLFQLEKRPTGFRRLLPIKVQTFLVYGHLMAIAKENTSAIMFEGVTLQQLDLVQYRHPMRRKSTVFVAKQDMYVEDMCDVHLDDVEGVFLASDYYCRVKMFQLA